ncbi:MAG: glycoside hydrolase family 78 protein [Bacteroidaceae bacterium]|nr:glycoside hydrolase family 78 protein [Bacteroidaceae bacterium]
MSLHPAFSSISTSAAHSALVLLCSALLLVVPQLASGQFRVRSLTVEHLSNPSAVDVAIPRLSWINEPKDKRVREDRQTAYRIVVSSSLQKLERGDYDLWDSGRVGSDASVLVPYGGRPLRSGEDCYWKVRTWNSRNRRSAWSPTGYWGMGLEASDWKALWITSDQRQAAPLFRKSFEVRRRPLKAKVFATAGGFFELYVNGTRAGDDYLVPNFTNYTTRTGLDKGGIALDPRFAGYRILYLAYDVTPLLHQGRNAVGAILGDGFYRSSSHRVTSFGQPCLLCQLEITYDDGSRDIITTDASWLTRPSAITRNGIYEGEIYDERLETPHWAETACNEQEWQHASLAIPPCGTLTAHTSPTDKITEILQPQSIQRRDSDFLVTFDKEIAGWVRLKDISAPEGQRVEVRYLSESPLGQQLFFKGRGNGPNSTSTYAPRFTWFVFSQVVVSGLTELTSAQIQAEAVNTDVPTCATFHTSNPLINSIYSIWKRSQLDNMHGCIASDCPHRERLPYTGDGQIASSMVMQHFDAAAFYQKWIRDIRDAQNPETGYVPNGAPWQPTCGGGVAWGAAMNIMPWEYYLYYGDRKLLEECYQPMRAQLRHMTTWLTPDSTMHQQMKNFETGDVCYWLNLGDWVPPFAMPADEIVHTFYLWLCAQNTAQAAQVLGDTEGYDSCRALAQQTWRAFHRKFYDAESASYGDYGPNILALYMGVPQERRAAVIQTLRREIMEEHNGHINTGFVTSRFFFETLSDCGLHEVAAAAMLKTDYPSYGHWLAQGATVTWEQWDGQNSHNHPMFGGGLTWFARHLAGVKLTEPGYRHFEVSPIPTQAIDSVYYDVDTPLGLLSSHVICHDGKLRQLEVTVPVGSTATIYLPSDTLQLHQGTHHFSLPDN